MQNKANLLCIEYRVMRIAKTNLQIKANLGVPSDLSGE